MAQMDRHRRRRLCAVIGLVYWLDLKRLYRLGLFATFAVLVWASHYGGSLTHGSDYLARYAPEPLRRLLGGPITPAPARNTPGALAEKRAFADVIQPVLEKNCVSCHGPEKAKAGLRLDTHPGLLKGSEHGPVIVAGKAADSELIKRLDAPAGARRPHAPRRQTATRSRRHCAAQLVDRCRRARRQEDRRVKGVRRPFSRSWTGVSAARRLLAGSGGARCPTQTAGRSPAPRGEADGRPEHRRQRAFAKTSRGSSATPASPGRTSATPTLPRSPRWRANLRWLDLAGTAVTDAALAQVGAMRHLTRLHLQRTAITDAGIAHLAGLAELESLNLYGTAVTDAALETLKRLPKLRQLYLWQSKVTPEAAKAFAEARVDKEQIAKWEAEIEQLQAQIRRPAHGRRCRRARLGCRRPRPHPDQHRLPRLRQARRPHQDHRA